MNIVRSLAGAPIDEQHGRDALNSLLELNEQVDVMVANPLSAEMQGDICIIALPYPGLNLFWDSKGVINISTLQFHDLIPYLGCLKKSDAHVKEKVLRPAYLKVMIVIIYLSMTCVNAKKTLPETSFSVTNYFFLVKSTLYKHELVDFTEKFTLRIFDELNEILQSFRNVLKATKNLN